MVIDFNAIKTLYLANNEVEELYINGSKVWEKPASIFTVQARTSNVTIGSSAQGSPSQRSLEYSVDNGETWNTFTLGSTTVTLANAGDKMMLRGTNSTIANTWQNYWKLTFSDDVDVLGNLNSLLGGSEDTLTGSLYGLFDGQTHLIDASGLVMPWTTIASIAVSDCAALEAMFRNCSGLVSAPDLPATTAEGYCYKSMFQNCTSLATAPSLPATTVGEECYQDMFNGCTALTTPPPALPAIDLPRSCYQGMFNGCSSLTATPATLGATTMSGRDAMGGMFGNCTSLKLVDWRNLSIVESNTKDLGACFYRTPSLQILDLHLSQGPFTLTTGTTTFRGTNPHAKILVPTGQVSAWKTTTGWNNRNVVQHITPYHDELTLSATDGDLTISYTKGERESQTYLYSLDGGISWTEWDAGDEVVVEGGSEMKVMGFNDNGPDEMNFHIQGTGCVVSGNIMSLVRGMNEDGDDMEERYGYHVLDEIPNDGDTIGSFRGLFMNCTAIVDAKNLELPATHLVSNMYEEMFMGCSNLVNGPFIPKTKSPDAGGYYVRMFSGCSSLQWVGLGMDTIPSAPFRNWLDNAGTGDIWFVGDSSYVPSGWTQTGLKSIIEMNGADEICDTHVFSDFLDFHIRLGIGGNAQGSVLFGHIGDNDNSDFRLFTLTDGRLFFDIGNDRLQQTNAWDTTEPWYDVEMDNFSLKWKKPSDATWSQLTGTTKTSINWKSDATFNIGQYNQNRQDVRCHYLRIYDGQTLKCDFVPCEDINGLPAVYDKVSGSWSYSNQNNSYVY